MHFVVTSVMQIKLYKQIKTVAIGGKPTSVEEFRESLGGRRVPTSLVPLLEEEESAREENGIRERVRMQINNTKSRYIR